VHQPRPRRLLVSILSLGRPENIQRQWAQIVAWLSEFSDRTGTLVHIAIRNNNPGVSFLDVETLLERTRESHPDIEATLFTGGPNLGFGSGHNANFQAIPSDLLLILNDDIGFPHLNWLPDAIDLLERDPRTALVADSGSPQHLAPFFGNGCFPGQHRLRTLSYAEASILLARSAIFAEVGMFAAKIDWAMTEDADLSLRVQQHGYRLAWLPIPHQHWRSTSFNALPGPVRSSILEHNRATLFATWQRTLTTGQVGRFVVHDLWSDGTGDIFCALPHLAAELQAMTPQQRANVVINTSRPELLPLLGAPDVRVVKYEDLGALEAALQGGGIAAIHSIRDVNYSLPFDIHALICGALGLRGADAAQLAAFGERLRAHVQRERVPEALAAGEYCVLHLEFTRAGHHGRALAPSRARDLLAACAAAFPQVVLIGREHRVVAPPGVASRVLDLQGVLSPDAMLAVVAGARGFVGIDSFPAHVAQAAGVPAAVFFGSVHPLARVWNMQRVWPIVADLGCLGCYHTQLEPSVPFCMRHDDACTEEVTPADLRRTVAAMAAGTPHDWSLLALRFRALQAKLMNLLRHHPSPPQRVFRDPLASNEQISNMIYQIIDTMGETLRGEYHTTAMRALTLRIADLEAESFAQAAALGEARRQLRARPAAAAPVPPAQARPATRLLQLAVLPLIAVRCRAEPREEWLEVAADSDDPQLYLPPLEGQGGRVRVRLTFAMEQINLVQVFWAATLEGFAVDRMEEIAVTSGVAGFDRVFDLSAGERLHLRIDPLAGSGRMRLRGSLAGAFSLASAVPATEDPVPAGLLKAVV